MHFSMQNIAKDNANQIRDDSAVRFCVHDVDIRIFGDSEMKQTNNQHYSLNIESLRIRDYNNITGQMGHLKIYKRIVGPFYDD